MKMNVILIITILIFISCVSKKTVPFLESPKPGRAFINKDSYRYIDFPYEDTLSADLLYEENFEEGGLRYGKIIDGYKEGKWISGDAGFDSLGNVYIKSGIWREEYFKKGLRDSVFRLFDLNNKIIYETTFKMGTGLWKEFHSNGKLYFEAYTKDGYFTDTLKLYNEKGVLMEKQLYKKDSLIFKENMIIDDFPTDNK